MLALGINQTMEPPRVVLYLIVFITTTCHAFTKLLHMFCFSSIHVVLFLMYLLLLCSIIKGHSSLVLR